MKSSRFLPICVWMALALASAAFLGAPSAHAADAEDAGNNGMFDDGKKDEIVDDLDPKYLNNGGGNELDEMQFSDAPGLLPNYGSTIYFVHKPGQAPNLVTMRIDFPLSISGCAKIVPPEVLVNQFGNRVQVTVSTPIIKLESAPQYSNNGCKTHVNSASAEFTLNRDELIKNKVNKISFKGRLGSDDYDLFVDERKISLYTKYRDTMTMKDKKVEWFNNKLFFKPVKSDRIKSPLTYWFYPENTVVLFVPLAPIKSDLSAEIAKFAHSHGLVDMKTVLAGFESPVNDNNTLYFVDQTGLMAAKLKDGEAPVGVVSVTETFYGPDGPYERPKSLEVHAKLPGITE